MNNAKSTIIKRGTQISIYTLIQYFECTYILYYYILIIIGVFKCKITMYHTEMAAINYFCIRFFNFTIFYAIYSTVYSYVHEYLLDAGKYFIL